MFKLATALLAASVSTFAIGASFMPENDLHLRPTMQADTMDQREFDRIIDQVMAIYKPLVKEEFSANLVVERAWNDRTVNAYAYQSGSNWYVKMFGGLAKRVTSEAFMLVLCHEIGHHLGGFPYVRNDWAANDGQSDAFATQVCMRKVLAEETKVNATFAKSVHPTPKKECDKAWNTDDDRNLCYRIVSGGKSVTNIFGRNDWTTPDRRRVTTTDHKHPPSQCRLDTYLAGAVCATQTWDDALIPGKTGRAGSNSRTAERASAEVSCHTANGDVQGNRPRCWFSPGI